MGRKPTERECNKKFAEVGWPSQKFVIFWRFRVGVWDVGGFVRLCFPMCVGGPHMAMLGLTISTTRQGWLCGAKKALCNNYCIVWFW